MAIMALHSAATGLRALSTQLDVISNNLANANNDGFKSSRVNFEDLLYEQVQRPGTTNVQGDVRPTGIAIGLGTRICGTQVDFGQGSLIETGRKLDVAIEGDGFFQVRVPPDQGDGLAYTRSGKFFVNGEGDLVLNSSDGFKIEPSINIGTDAIAVDISSDGRVFITRPGQTEPEEGPQIQLARFVNPQGLLQLGGNLYQRSAASGEVQLANPGSEGTGILRSSFVEASNVDPVRELVDLIKTQRTFELNSQSIQASDQMLQIVGNLRR